MKKIFDSTEQILRSLPTTSKASNMLPFSRDNFVKVPIRTKEQAAYAESLDKRIFVETIHLHNGDEMERYYCLMNYDTAIAHCL